MSDAARILREIIRAVYDTVKAAGDRGAPSSVVYSALMTAGCTLKQYDDIIDSMKHFGVIRHEGNLLFAVPEKARELGLDASAP